MKVLLLNGSPNKEGCTYTALKEVAVGLKEEGVDSEVFQLGTKPVRGCIACGKCFENANNKCVFDDDICNELSSKIASSDGLVIGSPVYYAAPNGALCAVLDRVFYSASSTFKFKPGASVVSCRRGGATAAFDRLNKYFTISQMPVVSSQYWNGVHGHDPDDVAKDLEGLQVMRVLGRNMAWLMKATKDAPKPTAEAERFWTSFPDGL